jgi:uncharacterized membrane protein
VTGVADAQTVPPWRKWDLGQIIKWTVYSLLLLNFFFYMYDEARIASYTLSQGGTFLQWTKEFATTIDEMGWFLLLFAFELETYALSDDAWTKKRTRWTLHICRLIGYLFLAHTVAARITSVVEFEEVTQAVEVTSLCQVADQEIYFGQNYEYTEIDGENCKTLSQDRVFYFLDPTVITDSDGHTLEEELVWIDLEDVVVWLLVVWAIELAVWLQNRDITGGKLMIVTHAAKIFYAVLFAHAGFWIWHGHWVYAWDQTLWICGFWAIEMNLSDWREDIREEGLEEELERESGQDLEDTTAM